MSVIILMSNSGAQLMHADNRAIQIVSELLSYEKDERMAGRKNSPKGTFLRLPQMIFESGFVPMVREALSEAGYAITLKDEREQIPVMGPPLPDMVMGEDGYAYLPGYLNGINLYDFQVEAAKATVLHRRGVVRVATGGGKTEIGILTTKMLGLPTLFLTHKLDLVEQTRARYFARTGEHVGKISEGEWEPSKITVATVQTIMAHWTKIWKVKGKRKIIDKAETDKHYMLACEKASNDGHKAPNYNDYIQFVRHVTTRHYVLEDCEIQVRAMSDTEAVLQAKREHMHTIEGLVMVEDRSIKVIELLRSIKFLITDEAHRSSGDSFLKIQLNCVNAYFRQSLTATPLMKGNRRDDLCLIATSGSIIANISNSELIKRGILAEPHFKFIEIPAFDINPKANYQVAYDLGIVNNEVRNQVILEETQDMIAEGRQTVVLYKVLKHGKILRDLFEKAGIRCRLVAGVNDTGQRKRALDDLAAGTINCIIASTIFDEGLDCDVISGLVLAGGDKAKIALFQRVGRAARKKKGDVLSRLGNTSRISDMIDTGHPHLHRHSALRWKAVTEEDGWVIDEVQAWSARKRIPVVPAAHL